MISVTRAHTVSSVRTAFRAVSTWSNVPAGPPDPILGVTEAFKADADPRKINLGVGAYRDGDGKPYVLNSVKKAEDLLRASNPDKEYLPITGLPEFTKIATKLAYGADSTPLNANAIAATQSISGTGALRIGGAFLARFYPHSKMIYLPVPSWGNHTPIFRDSGLEVRGYRYFDKKTGRGIAYYTVVDQSAPENSIVLLHACAHNPTGVDPTPAQWKEISDIVKEKKLFPFFDMAYQGFASGSTDRDALANMGLYGERAGAFSLTTADAEEKARVESQLKIVIRPMYSNPPLHGARIANAILSRPELYGEWKEEVKGMAERIISMRERLYNELANTHKTPGEWGHIKSQIGMFSFTGLTAAQTKALAERAHIYMTADGRISMAGLNGKNIDYFAESVSRAVKGAWPDLSSSDIATLPPLPDKFVPPAPDDTPQNVSPSIICLSPRPLPELPSLSSSISTADSSTTSTLSSPLPQDQYPYSPPEAQTTCAPQADHSPDLLDLREPRSPDPAHFSPVDDVISSFPSPTSSQLEFSPSLSNNRPGSTKRRKRSPPTPDAERAARQDEENHPDPSGEEAAIACSRSDVQEHVPEQEHRIGGRVRKLFKTRPAETKARRNSVSSLVSSRRASLSVSVRLPAALPESPTSRQGSEPPLHSITRRFSLQSLLHSRLPRESADSSSRTSVGNRLSTVMSTREGDWLRLSLDNTGFPDAPGIVRNGVQPNGDQHEKTAESQAV
ncbi:pyridoxal phosphate-dependent transferase [Lactarius psammicola]|nr:pyridoxal phosphate-dependent transferase [Lactarius psammicola]